MYMIVEDEEGVEMDDCGSFRGRSVRMPEGGAFILRHPVGASRQRSGRGNDQ